MYILLFALFTFAGGVVSALLGWLGTNEPFVAKKFTASCLKAFVAAMIAAGTGAVIPPVGLLATILMCILAFAAGAGADAGTKRLVNAVLPE